MTRLLIRMRGWREIPWGFIVILSILLAIVAGGVWSAVEIWQRAHDGVYTG